MFRNIKKLHVMSEYIFFNEDWNRETDYCYKHGMAKDSDGHCYKCLEEKNNRNGSNNRKTQRVHSFGKERIRKA